MAVAPELATPSTPLPTLSPSSLEQYLLLVLSDSNLPTGGFVASSGLESWVQHGYAALQADASAPSTSTPPPPPSSTLPGPEGPLLGFVRHSLHSYARLNVPLLCAAHQAVSSVSPPYPPSSAHPAKLPTPTDSTFQIALSSLVSTDALCEALTLNHVARRASIAQGIALLTLYERAFSPPPSTAGQDAVRDLVAAYRTKVRKGEDGACGHMSVAFAVLTAAVGVSLDSALPLFLFLHARSLLSSAVRLNIVGPYLAHRMLLWDLKPLVDEAVAETAPRIEERRAEETGGEAEGADDKVSGDWWDNDPAWKGIWDAGASEKDDERGPVTTWPLGEIVASRHDQLFSKVFNS
ncbi:Urease accessory protein UreF [Rhodotorula toruloides ATCC 204091]|uniref:Urease accessory protein UreF n=1 Tax=Rhodotorula toruloides TaxID=5286 RepID=A0A2S9ZWI2_RHOTO|nr:Urease accessory protein UreF [Rhodotorula toruloides ATCC 204091]PRQ70109.1 urease accessory protein UreF [Rhodotorula toruloides]